MRKNYGALGAITVLTLVIGIAIGLPFLIGGVAVVTKMIQLMFFTTAGGIPIWAIFLMIPAAILIFKSLGRR